METYPIDADPAQILRWLTIECEAAPAAFKIDARRTREIRPIPVRREDHLGDEEREDLTEIASVATLEIAPPHKSDGWMLRIIVEDDVGPRIPDRVSSAKESNESTLRPSTPNSSVPGAETRLSFQRLRSGPLFQ
jgi:hypothetical protein